MPEGCAWNRAGGVAERWKIHLLWKASRPIIFSSTYQKWQFVTWTTAWRAWLSPQNGISGSLISNIFDLIFQFISGCRVFICWWGGSGMVMSEGGGSEDELITLALARQIGYTVFYHSWLCFTCLNVPVLMMWSGMSLANSNNPERNKLRDLLQ